MKVFIFGGHGFIGRHIVKFLCESHWDVTVLDLKSKPKELENTWYEHVSLDILQGDLLRGLPWDDVDKVIHLVGLADAHVAQRNPAHSFRLNIEAFHLVLEACREHQVKHIIVPSTAAIYGAAPTVPVSEESPPLPTTVYAFHKLIVELLAKSYKENYGIDYTILRLFNVYGKGNQGIIDLCVRKAKKNEPLTLFGSDQYRDFIYVEDVAAAFTAAITHESGHNQIFNIGSGEGITIRQVASLVERQFPGWKVLFEEKADYVPYDSVADIERARSLLNFCPKVSKDFMAGVIREEYIHE